jgi:hypothetical protein
MVVLPEEIIESGLTGDGARELLEKLIAVNRMAGHDGEAEAAAMLASAFDENGLRDVDTT